MLIAIFCWTLLLSGSGAELQLTVTPEIVEPGVTPFFTLRCSVAEQEEANIAALAIYRRSVTAKSATSSPQLVAEILATSPTIPSVVPGFEGLTVLGQISQLEEELETFLEVVWPNPTVQELGTYSCEVTVLFEDGGATTLTEVKVTTSNAVTDRLLASVVALQAEFGVLNQTVQEIFTEIDNITQALDTEIRPAVDYYREEGRPSDNTTEAVPTEETTQTEVIETDEISGAEPTSYTSDVDLNIIAEGLEDLKTRLENINDTLGRINVVISSLTERVDAQEETTTEQVDAEEETTTEQVDAEEETTTEQVTTEPEVILTTFVSDNSSYALFKSTVNTDTRRAQVFCESKEHYLAEINDQIEFVTISKEISPYLDIGVITLVGGERRFEQGDFVFQNSQELVQFVTGDFRGDVDFPNGTCLALVRSADDLTFTSVPCSTDDEFYRYILCERAQF